MQNEVNETPLAEFDGDHSPEVVSEQDGSNNLIADSDTDEIKSEPGKVPVPKDYVIHVNADVMEAELTVKFDRWEADVGQAHATLYQALGQAYEWAPLLKSQAGTEEQIVNKINERHKPRVKVKVGKHSGEELLLMLGAGFGDRANSNRCNWLRALRAAEQTGQERNRTCCANWIKDEGGVLSAGKLYKKEGAPAKPAEPFNALACLKENAALQPHVTISLPEDDMLDGLADGIHVLVVDVRKNGKNREFEVLDDIVNSATLDSLARKHKAGKDRLDRLLWDLNRYTLKYAERWPTLKKITKRDVEAFAKATRELIDDPELGHRFFEEGAESPRVPADVSHKYRFPIVDFDVNVHDPARFIKGAKPGSLLRYKPDPKPAAQMSSREHRDSDLPQYLKRHFDDRIDPARYRERWDEQVAREDAEEREREAREARQPEDVN